ncbi:hypothetical protein G6F63_014961 [Rhizopus arrhizus]|nr:hypothetical protein G6F63_014961 [Rhizopus arrhizus]
MGRAPGAVGPAMRDHRHCLRNDGMTMTGAAPAVLLPESCPAQGGFAPSAPGLLVVSLVQGRRQVSPEYCFAASAR